MRKRGAISGSIIGGTTGHKNIYVLNASTDVIDIEVIDRSPFKVIEGGKVIISDRVGEEIDLEERNKYSFFTDIKGFHSAVLHKLPDGNYAFKTTYQDETTGETKIPILSSIRVKSNVFMSS